jgi:hypothetical protein
MKKLQKFETILDSLARRYGVHQVFSDFLTLLICAFSQGRMEKHYFETIRKYEKPYTSSFSEALAALVIEMTGPAGMVSSMCWEIILPNSRLSKNFI